MLKQLYSWGKAFIAAASVFTAVILIPLYLGSRALWGPNNWFERAGDWMIARVDKWMEGK